MLRRRTFGRSLELVLQLEGSRRLHHLSCILRDLRTAISRRALDRDDGFRGIHRSPGMARLGWEAVIRIGPANDLFWAGNGPAGFGHRLRHSCQTCSSLPLAAPADKGDIHYPSLGRRDRPFIHATDCGTSGPNPNRQVLGAKSVNLPFEQLGGAALAADNLVSDCRTDQCANARIWALCIPPWPIGRPGRCSCGSFAFGETSA